MNHSFLLDLALAVIPVVLAITLHEAAHGYMALALGDTTARDAGRLSLNPIRHIDRVGTIILPGFLLITQLLLPPHRVLFMFGWAKPVPVSAWRFPNPRRGMAIVAIAGPAMNFFLAWLAALFFPVDVPMTFGTAVFAQFLTFFMLTNVVLGLFNLLPIPPLDGGRIAVGFLPLPIARVWARMERAGLIIVLLGVFVLPQLLGIDPVGTALRTILPKVFRLLFLLAGHGDAGDGMDVDI
ncbi:site-2 protease family protein [Rhodopila sp.]|jgi:Zn-dependent protease|uniref:site-2 protease family protein n=1 Tax=Rhodopila sp. TaxID=2480087 RepID=UPI002B9DA71C|nr:site-2 protease family protein [Rhodopila sp.]HVZ06548.1 site-2 protease family protein [Rhodopila sp.]